MEDTMVTEDTIIVSGLPRSGTSLMMRMLEAGGMPVLCDGVRLADEDNPLGYYEFEPAKRTREDPTWLADAAGKAVKVVYKLLPDLPGDYRYRVLLMRRRIAEVLASQHKMLERQGLEATAPDAEMAELFQRDLRRCDQWLRAQENISVLRVDYNVVVNDSQQSIRQINTFLDRQLDEEAMCRVIRPELYRNRVAPGGDTPQ